MAFSLTAAARLPAPQPSRGQIRLCGLHSTPPLPGSRLGTSSRCGRQARGWSLIAASSSDSDAPKEKSVEGSLDALSKVLGTPTMAEERAAAEAEAEEERQREAELLMRKQRVDSQEALYSAHGALSVGFDLIPIERDGLLERTARNESVDILVSRLAWLKEHFQEGVEQPAPAGAPPPVPELAATGDTFLIPFIRAPYVQQLDTMSKMNLFEPRWITLFTKILIGSELASDSETKWLNGVSGNTPLILTDIPEVQRYNEGYDELTRGEPSLVSLQNTDACRLPEDPFMGSAQYGYICEDPASRQFAGVGTLMQITAYDTKDRRTLQVWSKGAGAFEVLRVVQELPYPIAEVRMLSRQPDASTPEDTELEAAATKIKGACADLYVKSLDVNLDREVRIPGDWEKLLRTREREDVVNEKLDVLAAVLLRKLPNASIDYLCSVSRRERLGIMEKAAQEAAERVDLGFDYLRKQQLQAMGVRGLLFLLVAFLVGLIIGAQTQQVDNLL